MGYRMTLYAKIDGPDKFVGDDHKLYGYVPLADVKNSVEYLFSIRKEISDDWYFRDTEDVNDFYDHFNYCCGPRFVMSEEHFSKFKELYLEDVKKNKDEDVYEFVKKYMTIVESRPGNKVVEWS